MESFLILFLAGFIGALVKEIVEDNKLTLPKKINGELALGFVGSCFVGGMAGLLVDGTPVTAALAGYTGYSVVKNFIEKKDQTASLNKVIIAGIIKKVAQDEGVDPDLACRVAECESSLNPSAVHTNKDSSKDRGLFQINDKCHPDVPDLEAFDIVLSTRFFCKAFKSGNLKWWNATRKCWEK